MDIPQKIIDELTIIANSGVKGEAWMPVKKYLLLSIPSKKRKNESRSSFSTAVVSKPTLPGFTFPKGTFGIKGP